MIVWINGELMPLEKAAVSPLDHGLIVGDGVFETLRTYGGVPFAWTRHLARLHASAKGLGLTAPDPGELRAAAEALIAANQLEEARLRITVTGGPAPPGSSRAPVPPTVIVTAFPLEHHSLTADVVIVPWTRNEGGALAGLKTISYAENVRALAYAQERGAQEAMFANTMGRLCEATGSNVFMVLDGTCCTPPLSSGCLNGVTRQLLLEIVENEIGIFIDVRDVPVDALRRADEAFLASTTREVQAIAAVDNVALAAPGPITKAFAAGLTELTASDIDP